MPPRLQLLAPACSYQAGDEAIRLAESAGLFLDPWQQYALRASLGERPDGNWAARRVGLVVSRQNGKGAVISARELAGIFLFGDRLILHSAHEFDTSLEAFYRIVELVEQTPSLLRRVAARGISYAHGKEGITLKSGQRLRFKARTLRGGRGFSGDVVILDEAMYLQSTTISALGPTMTAKPNPQLWYVGSPVDREEHPDGVVFSEVRDQAVAGVSRILTWVEWSAPPAEPPRSRPDQVMRPEDVDVDDRSLWPMGNPGLGGRLSVEAVEADRETLTRRGFAVERLGVGDWHRNESEASIVEPLHWQAGRTVKGDPASRPLDPVVFAADVTPDRRRASIGMCCRIADGRVLAEVVDDRDGVGWVVPRLLELIRRYDPVAVVVDRSSPGAAVIAELEKAGIEPTTTSAQDVAVATGGWLIDVAEGGFAHRDDPVLNDALAAASLRDLAGGQALDRRGSGPIAPLVAVVLARWGLLNTAPQQVVEQLPPLGVYDARSDLSYTNIQDVGF